MRFLSTEEGKVGGLVGVNVLMAVINGQPVTWNLETVLRVALLAVQIVVGVVTVWYIYRKGKKLKK